ncbi:hypothetical protein HanIR_Chr12g0615831 [Helianthus annuus]|nr:hypothetical protein HanIR_Chr12g0615831 [Helianthus annuus]
MILLHELTKILIVNISFLYVFVFKCCQIMSLRKFKKFFFVSINFEIFFSTTDVGELIFKIPNAKHDEQNLRGSVCVNLTVFINLSSSSGSS